MYKHTLLTNAKKKTRKIGFICEFHKQNHIQYVLAM